MASELDYSVVPADNTAINGVGITGSDKPSNLDDAMRYLAANRANAQPRGTAKSANYSAVKDDFGKLFSFSGAYTLTIPSISSVANGWFIYAEASDSAPLTIARSGSNTINGATSVTLPKGSRCRISVGVSATDVKVDFFTSSPVALKQIRRITVSGSVTFTPDVKAVLVRGVGGGGSGGAGGTAAATNASAASGGAAGGYFEKFISAPATATVTIGAGGAAVTSTGVTPVDGNAGGATTYADGTNSITANGGGAGLQAGQTQHIRSASGAVGGTASGADLNRRGDASEGCVFTGATINSAMTATSSNGAGTPFGTGGLGGAIYGSSSTQGNGADATGYGSGGGGGSRLGSSAGTSTSGAGAPGYIEIWEYV